MFRRTGFALTFTPPPAVFGREPASLIGDASDDHDVPGLDAPVPGRLPSLDISQRCELSTSGPRWGVDAILRRSWLVQATCVPCLAREKGGEATRNEATRTAFTFSLSVFLFAKRRSRCWLSRPRAKKKRWRRGKAGDKEATWGPQRT